MAKLKLAVRDYSAFERAIDAQIQAFQGEIRVERHSFDIQGMYELATGGESDFDLIICLTDWLPEAVTNGCVLLLDRFFEEDPPEDWPEGWSPSMRKLCFSDGRLVAMPWHDGPEVFHYRKDLFTDAGERTAFRATHGYDLNPPKTWEHFLDVAKFFTRDDMWGCCVAAYPDGHNNVYDFLIHLWSRGGELLEGGKPAFASRAGVEALEFYADLIHRHKVAPESCLIMDSNESGEFYALGEAAMMWNWSGFAATAELSHSKIRGCNACTAIPGNVSLNVYWTLAILSGSRNAGAAYEFLKHACSAPMDKLTAKSGASGVRLSTWRDPEIQKAFPYYGILEEVHKGARTLPALPEYPDINDALNRAIERVTHDRRDAGESLSQAQTEVEGILGTTAR